MSEDGHGDPGVKPRMSRRRFLTLAGGAAGLAAAAAYPVAIERYIILTRRHRVPVPNLPPAFAGFTVAHLTDLHHGFLVPLSVIRHVVARTTRLDPDLVVCTGDFVHEKNATGEIDRVWPVLGQLRARHGVYSVLGNHDHWADTERSQYWLERTKQNLRHRTHAIERDGQRLWLAGAGDLWQDHVGLDTLLKSVPQDECRIVLAHNPDTADSQYSERVDLMVCGHTHGGQVVVPFMGPPVLSVRNRTYSSGLKTSPRGERVFISRGIGWAIYPVRFNCYPEIAVLELRPA